VESNIHIDHRHKEQQRLKELKSFIFVFAILAVYGQNECCSPQQWEGDAAGFSRRNNETFFEYISYDFANRRVRADLYERIWFNHEIKIVQKTLIEKEVQGVTYVYDIEKDGTCTYKQNDHEVRQMCVRSGYSHKYDYTIGGELQATLYQYRQRDYDEEVEVASKTCIPIAGFVFNHHERHNWHMDFDIRFWNVQLGIRNPNVFNTPADCKKQN